MFIANNSYICTGRSTCVHVSNLPRDLQVIKEIISLYIYTYYNLIIK